MMQEAKARTDLIRYSHDMYRAGWVANHDGNLSVRVDEDRFVCTPTSFSKIDVTHDDLVVINGQGQKTAGRRRAFSELNLHLAIYRLRPKVQAVVHSHAPFASAFAVAQRSIPHPFMPEAVVSLGDQIPLVPLATPGQDALEAMTPFIEMCDALIVTGNGVWSWGPSIELAYLRMELVEHLAHIAHRTMALGGVKKLPTTLTHTLLQKRHKAGLRCPREVSTLTSTSSSMVEKVSQHIQTAFPSISSSQVEKLTQEDPIATTEVPQVPE